MRCGTSPASGSPARRAANQPLPAPRHEDSASPPSCSPARRAAHQPLSAPRHEVRHITPFLTPLLAGQLIRLFQRPGSRGSSPSRGAANHHPHAHRQEGPRITPFPRPVTRASASAPSGTPYSGVRIAHFPLPTRGCCGSAHSLPPRRRPISGRRYRRPPEKTLDCPAAPRGPRLPR
jgi:hypothetical protein